MLFKILHSVGNLLWNKFSSGADSDLSEEENRLEKSLEALNNENSSINTNNAPSSSPDLGCTRRSGKITFLNDDFGIINESLMFKKEHTNHFKLKVNDTVDYLIFENSKLREPVIKIIKVYNSFWNQDSETIENESKEVDYEISEQSILGKVIERDGRQVTIDSMNIKFNLDNVVSNFIPVIGDWIYVTFKAQVDPERSFNKTGEVLLVESMRCSRSKSTNGVVTLWDKKMNCGIIDYNVFFTKSVVDGSFEIFVRDKVAYDSIESDQGKCSWRALSVVLDESSKKLKKKLKSENSKSHNRITMSDNFNIGDIHMGDKQKIIIEMKNEGTSICTLLRCEFKSNFSQSQIQLLTTNTNVSIAPGEVYSIVFETRPKFMGYSKEYYVFTFDGFEILRSFRMNVIDPTWNDRFIICKNVKNRNLLLKNLERIKNGAKQECFPGVRLIKPPPFMAIRYPSYELPTYYIDLFHKSELQSNLQIDVESKFKFLVSPLNKFSYGEKFHTLQYFEEIANFIRYKSFDMENGFMTKVSEFMCLEIEGLHERRPTLQLGDTVKVKNPWKENGPWYQGFIHKISDDAIFLKFCSDFHHKYTGESVSIEFFFTRTIYRKCHFAIDMALSHLDSEILFPDRIKLKEKQLEIESDDDLENVSFLKSGKKQKIIWNNPKLNSIQKTAVLNILKGTTRPLPYIIFGPPGTGKTVTLVELILQLMQHVPSSRLLIATPSNSAATLLLERLVRLGKFKPGFVVRLLAINQINNNNIPDNLKPYCATVNISSENSNKGNHHMDEKGISFDCDKSTIGRHRITIGTCITLGSLVKMGFPSGHFTHVIVDEAGQTTEPEVMIPLSLISKQSGQIILSGDPLQLGPVVMSRIASKYGLGESFLERLLTCAPYKQDIEGHGKGNDGYDSRLVTKLRYNYRSIQKVMEVTNKMFYNNSLLSKMDESVPTIQDYITKISGMFNCPDVPGILFHGIRGINYRNEDDPSWFNPQEASMILMFLCKLYKNNIPPDDIGIITPYSQQVKYLRMLISDLGISTPKIGSVEEFQGQERKIIIISMVRSNEKMVNRDITNQMGFVLNRKRVNVALSRAQYMLVIYGNPHLLAFDPLWCSIIKHIVDNGGYLGCNLPEEVLE